MKTGLAMEGGAMRGLFTCGVIDVLMENDITFDGGAGISAGAVFGCNFKSRQHGRPLRYNLNYCKDPRYGSMTSLIRTGDIFDADFCYREVPMVLDPFDSKSFEENPMKFYVGATNIETGECEYHLCSDGLDEDTLWMRASASMPLVSRPVLIEGHYYLDGGVADSIPHHFLKTVGFDHNVVVLTQPKGYEKKKSKEAVITSTLMKKYPELCKAMNIRHIRYNDQLKEIDEEEKNGFAFVIRPPEALGISRISKDRSELERVYQIGRKVTEEKIEDISSFLKG
ncbi:MAG: patatin family protein [Erysipelotrichaceae bacterium]|nr:patatin family protein [Erysipelotrichaceae bacterium]